MRSSCSNFTRKQERSKVLSGPKSVKSRDFFLPGAIIRLIRAERS